MNWTIDLKGHVYLAVNSTRICMVPSVNNLVCISLLIYTNISVFQLKIYNYLYVHGPVFTSIQSYRTPVKQSQQCPWFKYVLTCSSAHNSTALLTGLHARLIFQIQIFSKFRCLCDKLYNNMWSSVLLFTFSP